MIVNLDKLDKIVLKGQEDLKKLLEWRDLNKDLVREFKPSLTEGLIVMGDYKQYFKQEGHVITYRIWFGERKVMDLIVKFYANGYRTAHLDHVFEPELGDEYMMDAVTTHASLMAYMANYERHVTKRYEYLPRKNKNGKPSKQKKKAAIKLGRRVYSVDVPQVVTTDKRPYERQAKSWEVKGHPRFYKKTGKTIWIEKFVKGDKNTPKEPKTYKL